MFLTLTLVFLGGAVGGVARFWVSTSVDGAAGGRFPWGTLVVNVSGALLLGLLLGVLVQTSGHSTPAASPIRALLAVGVLGSYTTVSSFSLQTLSLIRAGQPGNAVMNVMLSFVLCLVAGAMGLGIGQWAL